MQPKPVQPSDLFPLPPDYEALTFDGQRLARVNACVLWRLKTPNKEERVRNYLEAFAFFTETYLKPDDEFDPLFYEGIWVPPPPSQWFLLRSWLLYRMNVAIGPRGQKKSFLNGEDMLLRHTTWPGYSTVYATINAMRCSVNMQRMRNQWLWNQRLNDDFRPEFPFGKFIPSKGQAPFSNEHIMLRNGAQIQAVSVESGQRGIRPMRYRLDDPENDEKKSTDMSTVRANMETLLFRIILPAVAHGGSGVDWLATFVSKKHFAWHAMALDHIGEVWRAKNPLFNRWNRILIKALSADDEGTPVSSWPEMWPATKAERMRRAETEERFNEQVSLEELRDEVLGPSVFKAEMQGEPGEAEDSYFPVLNELDSYWYSNPDPEMTYNPRESRATIHWYHVYDGKPHERQAPLHQFLGSAFVFAIGDTSHTAKKTSDYKALLVMCRTQEGDLFGLECWAEQIKEDTLIRKTFEMGSRWGARALYCEAIKQGMSYLQGLRAYLFQGMTGTYRPGIIKLQIGQAAKESKIGGIRPWFELHKIKLPLSRRNDRHWSMLFDQIEGFHPDVKDGGLEHDDLLDDLAGSQFVFGKGAMRATQEEAKTVVERMKDGESHDEYGNPLWMSLDLASVPLQDIDEIAYGRTAPKEHGTRI